MDPNKNGNDSKSILCCFNSSQGVAKKYFADDRVLSQNIQIPQKLYINIIILIKIEPYNLET